MLYIVIFCIAGALSVFFSALALGGQYGFLPLISSLATQAFAVGALTMYFSRQQVQKGQAPKNLPHVAVVKTCCNEPAESITRSMSSLLSLDYPKEKISFHLLDDSTDSLLSEELSQYCKKTGINYSHRQERSGFKAGALNSFVATCKADLIALFDSDESIEDKSFLLDNMHLFSDLKVAAVQANKDSAAKGIGGLVSLVNGIYYNFVNPANNAWGSASFLGSMAIVRVTAIRDCGGFPESLIEDADFSLSLFVSGHRTVHVQKRYGSCGAPSSFSAYSRQHSRYIAGMRGLVLRYFSVLNKLGPKDVLILGFQYAGMYFTSFFQLFIIASAAWMALSGAMTAFASAAFIMLVAQGIFAACAFSERMGRKGYNGLFMYAMNMCIIPERLITALHSAVFAHDFVPTATLSKSSFAPAIIPSVIALALLVISFPLNFFTPLGIAYAALFLSYPAFIFKYG
jgi:cellulose synthase (UDP-forming)